MKNCGGLDKAISVARETGYGICAKFHDGDPADDGKYGFQEDFRSLAERCGPLGIPLISWGYCHGDKYGNLDKEVAAAAISLKQWAQAYIVDAEAEWEVPEAAEWAKRFMSDLLKAVPGAEAGMTTYWTCAGTGHSRESLLRHQAASWPSLGSTTTWRRGMNTMIARRYTLSRVRTSRRRGSSMFARQASPRRT